MSCECECDMCNLKFGFHCNDCDFMLWWLNKGPDSPPISNDEEEEE